MHVHYVLDTANKVAHRQQLPSPPDIPVGQAKRTGYQPPDGTKIESEELGTKLVEGEFAEGFRSTITSPARSQGSDRPVSTTSETWMSRELRVVILLKTNDSNLNETSVRLTNISRFEPDASLFELPPEYTIAEESGAFTIQWGSPR